MSNSRADRKSDCGERASLPVIRRSDTFLPEIAKTALRDLSFN